MLLVVFALLQTSAVALDPIQGTYHAWWALIDAPTTSVQSALPNAAQQLVIPKSIGIATGRALFALEMGREHDCGPIGLKALRKDFMEFKFEIPWVQIANTSKIVTYKKKIYQDNEEEVLGSRIYGLNASRAEIEMNATDYTIDTTKFHATFKNTTPSFAPASKYPNFAIYETIVNQTWFGDATAKTCAQHHYDFTTAIVRPANASITIRGESLEANLPETFSARGIDASPFGVAEVWLNFTMTTPFACH
ncbi:uncharacterized protein [Oscarella lobularis]|uniref:uncharacterized protein n=1 Tax=Oscarella lobularis TaxID=121494 RepID=UPI0033136936